MMEIHLLFREKAQIKVELVNEPGECYIHPPPPRKSKS